MCQSITLKFVCVEWSRRQLGTAVYIYTYIIYGGKKWLCHSVLWLNLKLTFVGLTCMWAAFERDVFVFVCFVLFFMGSFLLETPSPPPPPPTKKHLKSNT